MFVDLMGDIHHTFTERFLRAQLVFNPSEFAQNAPEPQAEPEAARRPTRRYNALGILEDIAEEPAVSSTATNGASASEDEADGAEPATAAPVRASNPTVVGAGRARTINEMAGGTRGGSPADFATAGRNDPCPCGSGKKFKKCHGAGA